MGRLQDAGIPLKQTVNESDWDSWHAALEAPASHAAYVVGFEGDAVSKAVAAHPEGLEELTILCGTGQGCARVFGVRSGGGSRGGDGCDFAQVGRPHHRDKAAMNGASRGVATGCEEWVPMQRTINACWRRYRFTSARLNRWRSRRGRRRGC